MHTLGNFLSGALAPAGSTEAAGRAAAAADLKTRGSMRLATSGFRHK